MESGSGTTTRTLRNRKGRGRVIKRCRPSRERVGSSVQSDLRE